MAAINYDAVPKCEVCLKRYLLHQDRRRYRCCYPCGRRKLRVYCDHCSWEGVASVNGPCPRCEAYGRLHLANCGVFGHIPGCRCGAQDRGAP